MVTRKPSRYRVADTAWYFSCPLRNRAALFAFVVVTAFAVWLRWPAVRAGFYLDDGVQIAMLRGQFPAHRGPLDLFRFADEARDGRALVDFGYDAWWTEPGFRIALFRPLSSALTALDYRLFGVDAFAFHLHSVLWSVAVVGAAALFLARMVPRAALPFAIVFFALDEGQTAPFLWLANRSTLVSSAFGFLALFVHVARRERGATPGAPFRWRAAFIEGALFTLSLLGGEYGYGLLAYVLSYEAFAEGDRRDRARELLPALIPAAACLFGAAALGYGVRASAFYLSPFGSPARFVEAVFHRVPALYGDLFLGRAALDWVSNPSGRTAQELVGVLGLAAFAALAFWAARALPRDDRRRLFALAAGSALAAVPQATGMPEDRLLVAASAGAAGVFATFLVEAWRRRLSFRGAAGSRRRAAEAAFAIAALGVCVPLVKVHAYDAPGRSRGLVDWFVRAAPALRAWSDGAEIPERAENARVLLVAGADFTTTANVPWLRALDGHAVPRTYFRLSGSSGVNELVRVGANVLDVRMMTSETESVFSGGLYRSTDALIRRRDVFAAKGVKVEVILADWKNPRWVRFTFDRDLDDPSFVLLHPMGGRIRRIGMPAIGDKLRLPPPEQPPI